MSKAEALKMLVDAAGTIMYPCKDGKLVEVAKDGTHYRVGSLDGIFTASKDWESLFWLKLGI